MNHFVLKWIYGWRYLVDRFLNLVRKLEASGDVATPQTIVRKRMSLMPHQYRSVAHKIDQYPMEKQTLLQAIHALREEARYFELSAPGKPKKEGKDGSETALQMTEKRKCFNCNTVGHIAKDCNKPKKARITSHDIRQRERSNHNEEQANYGGTDEHLFVTKEVGLAMRPKPLKVKPKKL